MTRRLNDGDKAAIFIFVPIWVPVLLVLGGIGLALGLCSRFRP